MRYLGVHYTSCIPTLMSCFKLLLVCGTHISLLVCDTYTNILVSLDVGSLIRGRSIKTVAYHTLKYFFLYGIILTFIKLILLQLVFKLSILYLYWWDYICYIVQLCLEFCLFIKNSRTFSSVIFFSSRGKM